MLTEMQNLLSPVAPLCAVDEYYTTQRCQCGGLRAKCAGSTEQVCVVCGVDKIRDHNSAENIRIIVLGLLNHGHRPDAYCEDAIWAARVAARNFESSSSDSDTDSDSESDASEAEAAVGAAASEEPAEESKASDGTAVRIGNSLELIIANKLNDDENVLGILQMTSLLTTMKQWTATTKVLQQQQQPEGQQQHDGENQRKGHGNQVSVLCYSLTSSRC